MSDKACLLIFPIVLIEYLCQIMITREERIDFIRLSIHHFPRLPAQVIIAVRLLGPNRGSAPSQRPPRRNPRPEEAQQPATEYSPNLKTNNLPIFGSTLDYFYFRFRQH